MELNVEEVIQAFTQELAQLKQENILLKVQNNALKRQLTKEGEKNETV